VPPESTHLPLGPRTLSATACSGHCSHKIQQINTNTSKLTKPWLFKSHLINSTHDIRKFDAPMLPFHLPYFILYNTYQLFTVETSQNGVTFVVDKW